MALAISKAFRMHAVAHHPRLEHGEEEGGGDAAGHTAQQQDPPVVEVLGAGDAGGGRSMSKPTFVMQDTA